MLGILIHDVALLKMHLLSMYKTNFFLYLMLHAVPRFGDFTVTGMDESSVTASWTLETPGFIPPGEIESLEEMTVRWVLASDSLVITSSNLVTLDPNSLQFPENNSYVRTFGSDDLAQSGRMFNLTFEDLQAESRYIVQIEGVNSLGSSLTFFAFDTSELHVY